jgi:hypothetical protein
MTVCDLFGVPCVFGENEVFRWRSPNKDVERALNAGFIGPTHPEDPDPYLTVAKKAAATLKMVIVSNKPPTPPKTTKDMII